MSCVIPQDVGGNMDVGLRRLSTNLHLIVTWTGAIAEFAEKTET